MCELLLLRIPATDVVKKASRDCFVVRLIRSATCLIQTYLMPF